MMIQHALHQDEYLDVAKFYYKVWETPSIKEDTNGKGKAVCSHPLYLSSKLTEVHSGP